MRQFLNKQMNQKSQKGVTFLGMAIIIGILIFGAIIGMKMAPAYIEYMAVKKVVHAMAQESLNTMSKKDIKDAFNRRASIDDIHSITADDLNIEKDETGSTVVSTQYQVIKPIMGNVSVMIDFTTSSNSK